MRGIHPDVPIWLAAIDEGLDSNAYIFCQVSATPVTVHTELSRLAIDLAT
jgi:hypothetical protein